ncbi:uncharacterized protein LOC117607980 [Osmia lignaria lignaria]|uniref:uncharacterized protein LOC117607980 n=1 Tax=Osmia lignaria lignaria TaxID=1437193 RepID=UPI00402BC198
MTDDTVVRLIVSLVSIIFVGVVVSAHSQQQCSPFCVCDSWYGLQRASCTGRHLNSIDTSAPDSVQAMDLADNVISLLSNYELMNAGRTKLKYLNLSGNSISEIDLDAFDGLNDLTVLDLSMNHLYYILSDVFVKNNNLQVLRLSKNNFNSQVPKLQSSSLMDLSLDSCQISHLPLDTFNGLTHVHRLDLSNNLMIQMSSTVVQTLHLLKKLSLEGNPWSCNKLMLDLQEHLRHRNVKFQEVCGHKTGPKKFEKMILSTVRKHNNSHLSINRTIQKTNSATEYNVSNVSIRKSLSTCENTVSRTNSTNSGGHVSYWLFFIGFIVGLSSGMFISYFWLSGMISCWRYTRHTPSLSLLFDSYLQNRTSNDGNLIESCPGTPPPPYREVMLRPNIYRCPSTASNLNNNGTGYR